MNNRRTVMNTGFSSSTAGLHTIEVIQQISQGQEVEGRPSVLAVNDRKNTTIQRLIKMADSAYMMDGIIRQTVDKYSEQFKDFHLSGGDRQVKYVEKRLNKMSLRMGESWKTTFTRAINEYFKVGNAYVTKIRGFDASAVKPVYANKPYAVVGIRLVSASNITPKIDTNGVVLGWKSANLSALSPETLLTNSEVKLPRRRALVELPVPEDPEVAKTLLYPGVDFCHLAYKKPADCVLGMGMTFPGLDDVSILRTIESNTAIMIKKYSTPLLWHMVKRLAGVGGNMQSEIDRATYLHKRMSPDGVIVTGENHDLKTLGAESMALRLEGYLDFFTSRACVGVGGSSDLLGLRSSTLSTAQASNDRMMAKVRFCQTEITRELEQFLLWELLWEGGFDPFNKEEDRVFIEVVDVDEDRTIKLQTHAADLFNKNLVDHEGASKIAGFKDKPKEHDMHFTKYQKPLKDIADKKKAASKEQFIADFSRLAPRTVDEVEDSLYIASRLYGYKTSNLFAKLEEIQALVGDWEAAMEYMYSLLQTEDDEG